MGSERAATRPRCRRQAGPGPQGAPARSRRVGQTTMDAEGASAGSRRRRQAPLDPEGTAARSRRLGQTTVGAEGATRGIATPPASGPGRPRDRRAIGTPRANHRGRRRGHHGIAIGSASRAIVDLIRVGSRRARADVSRGVRSRATRPLRRNRRSPTSASSNRERAARGSSRRSSDDDARRAVHAARRSRRGRDRAAQHDARISARWHSERSPLSGRPSRATRHRLRRGGAARLQLPRRRRDRRVATGSSRTSDHPLHEALGALFYETSAVALASDFETVDHDVDAASRDGGAKDRSSCVHARCETKVHEFASVLHLD